MGADWSFSSAAASSSRRWAPFGNAIDRRRGHIAKEQVRLAAGEASALADEMVVLAVIENIAEQAATIAVDAGVAFVCGDEMPNIAFAMPCSGADGGRYVERSHSCPSTLRYQMDGVCHDA